MSGSMASTVAMATDRFSPPDSRWVGLSARCSAPASDRATDTLFRTSASERPWFSGPKATSSNTVGMKSWSSESWKTNPILRRTSAAVFFERTVPPTSTVPPEGRISPVRASIMVDFPAPLAPTRAQASPCSSRKETPFSASVPSG